MESFKSALESIGRMWSHLTATQRVFLVAAAAAMAGLLVWGSTSTTESWVRVAGPEVDQTSRYNILRGLQDRGQKHEVRGAEIFVPRQDADRVILELAGDGALTEDGLTKVLETNDMFMSSGTRSIQVKRALEQRLASIIRRSEGVRNASVMITPASESDRMMVAGTKAKASVQVELQPGKGLAPRNVAAICNLVARAVPGLDPDQVVIFDNKLNSYLLPAADAGMESMAGYRDAEKAFETNLQNQIRDALPYRTARVIVRAWARTSTMEKKTTKLSNPKASKEEEHSVIERTGAALSPKTLKKGEGDAAPVQDQEPGSRTEKDSKTENRFDQEETRISEFPGQIEKVSIGVLIPIEAAADSKEFAEEERKLPKIRDLVETVASTLEPQQKSSVSVQLFPMKLEPPSAAPAQTETSASWFSRHWTQLGLLVLALGGLVVLGLVFRGAMAKDTVEELGALASALQEEPAGELALPTEGDVSRLKRGIQEMVGHSPKAVAASLKSFMSGR